MAIMRQSSVYTVSDDFTRGSKVALTSRKGVHRRKYTEVYLLKAPADAQMP